MNTNPISNHTDITMNHYDAMAKLNMRKFMDEWGNFIANFCQFPVKTRKIFLSRPSGASFLTTYLLAPAETPFGRRARVTTRGDPAEGHGSCLVGGVRACGPDLGGAWKGAVLGPPSKAATAGHGRVAAACQSSCAFAFYAQPCGHKGHAGL